MRRRIIIACIAIAAASAGCGVFTDERACTLIGCYSGLEIEIQTLPPTSLLLSVRLPDGTVLARECLPQLCVLGAFFEGVDAPTVEIAVTMNGHTETFTKDLTYVSAHPNGEDCPPVCSVALVRLKSLGDPAAAA